MINFYSKRKSINTNEKFWILQTTRPILVILHISPISKSNVSADVTSGFLQVHIFELEKLLFEQLSAFVRLLGSYEGGRRLHRQKYCGNNSRSEQ